LVKVLHIFGQMVRHGAEVRTIELMPEMARRNIGFDFCTLLPDAGELDADIRDLGGRVVTCPLKTDVRTFPRRFLALLRSSDYDIVHCHSHYFSGYLLRLAHKAAVPGRIAHFRSMGDGRRLTPARRLYHWAMRRMIDRHATAILAVGRGAMECAWGPLWRSDPRCQVVHNGFDLTRFENTAVDRPGVRREFAVPHDGFLAVYVARFIPEKAHDILLTAAALVMPKDPGLHVLLVGDGDGRPAVEALAHDLGIEHRVHFTGVRDDVPRLLKASDCFVSTSRREGLPGAVLEAIVANLPVIATDLPGVREIAEYTDLISIVPVDNSDALARTLADTLNRCRSGPPKERPFPREFSLQQCAERLYDVYRRQLRPTTGQSG